MNFVACEISFFTFCSVIVFYVDSDVLVGSPYCFLVSLLIYETLPPPPWFIPLLFTRDEPLTAELRIELEPGGCSYLSFD
jgi:hypothetical protein